MRSSCPTKIVWASTGNNCLIKASSRTKEYMHKKHWPAKGCFEAKIHMNRSNGFLVHVLSSPTNKEPSQQPMAGNCCVHVCRLKIHSWRDFYILLHKLTNTKNPSMGFWLFLVPPIRATGPISMFCLQLQDVCFSVSCREPLAIPKCKILE